jgi:PIN domain nuclease of toxin-antitoxin system
MKNAPGKLMVVCELPFHHRDPFDRLIIAQSQIEKLPIISTDTIFDSYDVKREWE